LLEENRRTLGRPEKRDEADFRDVYAFIEKVNGIPASRNT
jgi:hypothetical protein